MKITIDFDAEGEIGSVLDLLKGRDYRLLLHSLSEEMRLEAKHNNDEGAARWRERLYDLAQEYGLVIE